MSDRADAFERVRDLIADQRLSGALCDAEAAGAAWAVDVLQALIEGAAPPNTEALRVS